MAFLLDTTILGRLANRADASYTIADAAVAKLFMQNETLHITAQNLIEFRNIATRQKAQNGLGLSVAEAESKAAIFEASFSLLVETADIFPAWKALVGALGVIGKQVHDARLVAVCQVHRVSHLLTFNLSHFTSLTTGIAGPMVMDPASV
jgi:predicted nucleic acid-binding protein